MRFPSSSEKAVSALAAPISTLAAAALLWSASNAAFSASTRDAGTTWSTGSFGISDDDAGSAAFQATNMLPGQTQSRCMVVTANTSAPGIVRAYAVNPVTTSQDLSRHVLISIQSGHGGSFGSCTGFTAEREDIPATSPISLAEYGAINDFAHATLMPDWVVDPGTPSTLTRTYKLTSTFATTGMTQSDVNALQGQSAGLDLQWELQNS